MIWGLSIRINLIPLTDWSHWAAPTVKFFYFRSFWRLRSREVRPNRKLSSGRSRHFRSHHGKVSRRKLPLRWKHDDCIKLICILCYYHESIVIKRFISCSLRFTFTMKKLDDCIIVVINRFIFCKLCLRM